VSGTVEVWREPGRRDLIEACPAVSSQCCPHDPTPPHRPAISDEETVR
jgi:hypothetical protein